MDAVMLDYSGVPLLMDGPLFFFSHLSVRSIMPGTLMNLLYKRQIAPTFILPFSAFKFSQLEQMNVSSNPSFNRR